MSFYADKKDFTHYAYFYGIPLFLNTETGELVGRNDFYDYLFMAAVWFHNAVIERFAQLFAAIFDQDYQPGFPIKAKSIEDE